MLAASDAGSLPPGVPPFEGTPRAVPPWRDGPAAGGVSAAARLLVLGVLVEGGESYTHGRSHVYAHDDTHFHVYLSACVIFMCPYICPYTCMRTIHMPAYMSTHMLVHTSMPVSIHIHTDIDKNRHITGAPQLTKNRTCRGVPGTGTSRSSLGLFPLQEPPKTRPLASGDLRSYAPGRLGPMRKTRKQVSKKN